MSSAFEKKIEPNIMINLRNTQMTVNNISKKVSRD
jgi:hypothetical protein